MDSRLKAAGYAIKPIFISGSLPSYLIVTLNGIELPGSRCTLATPADAGDAAFLAAEREAFDDCKAFAWAHAHPYSAKGEPGALPLSPAAPAPFPVELAAPEVSEPGHYGTANDSEIGAEDFAEQVQLAAEMGRELDREEDAAADPRDAKIAALVAEVERLAVAIETYGPGENYTPDRNIAAISARALLRRLGLAMAAGLLASGLWASPAPAAGARQSAPAGHPAHLLHLGQGHASRGLSGPFPEGRGGVGDHDGGRR